MKDATLDKTLELMNRLPDAVIGFDAEGRIDFANAAAQDLWNMSDRQLCGKSVADVLGAAEAAFEAACRVIAKNHTVTLHDVVLAGRPAESVVLATVTPGARYMMAVRLPPVQLDSAWNEKTKYSLKTAELVARMLAHEVKNPLAGIHGAAQLLEKAGGLAAEDRELVALIRRETQRIRGIVDKFNIFDDVPRDQYRAVNLHEVLGRVTGLARAEFGAGLTIVEDFDPSLPEVFGHFDHLVQAQLNLIKNAAEAFADKAGRIAIRTYYDTAPAYHPERPEKLPLCVEIEDDGQGIAPEAVGRIFQPYYTTKTSGQGLGLPIVSRIVDAHGGTINVSSKPGRTVFKISLPVTDNLKRAS